jgi:MSHA pilin protein MshA
MGRRGFTLIELIMVIVILGILAAVAIPQYFDLKSDAETAAEKGIIGGVRAGIQTYFAKHKDWPTELDGAADDVCDTNNVCFNNVLAQGGITTSDWSKSGATYTYDPTGGSYTYDSGNGTFATP